MEANSRQGRLRPEYASWYPGVPMTRWYPVSILVRMVARQVAHLDPRGGRTLDDRHFEFRGGVERDASWRTRAGDTTVWPAGRRSGAPDEKHRG